MVFQGDASLEDNVPPYGAPYCQQTDVPAADLTQLGISSSPYSGTSKIDQYARILFPLAFAGFNLVYWVVYLSKDTMELNRSLWNFTHKEISGEQRLCLIDILKINVVSLLLEQ